MVPPCLKACGPPGLGELLTSFTKPSLALWPAWRSPPSMHPHSTSAPLSSLKSPGSSFFTQALPLAWNLLPYLRTKVTSPTCLVGLRVYLSPLLLSLEPFLFIIINLLCVNCYNVYPLYKPHEDRDHAPHIFWPVAGTP